MAKRGRPKSWDAKYEVDFGGLSIGDASARLGVKLSRERATYDEADELLCGRRCVVQIINNIENPKEQLPGMEGATSIVVDAVADIKGFATSPKLFTFGLTLVLEEVDPSLLAKFPKRRGVLLLKHTEDLQAEESDGADDE